MSDTPTVEEVVERLRLLARPNALEGMARFGIATECALGVSMPDLRVMGKSLGRNQELALDLWRTPLRETRILASLVADAQQMTGGAASRPATGPSAPHTLHRFALIWRIPSSPWFL